MTAFWIAVFVGLLVLCFGVLIGSSWAVQALDRERRRQRRMLHERLRALQQIPPVTYPLPQPDHLIHQ